MDRHKHSRSLSHPHTLAHIFNREGQPHETETGRCHEIHFCFPFFPLIRLEHELLMLYELVATHSENDSGAVQKGIPARVQFSIYLF